MDLENIKKDGENLHQIVTANILCGEETLQFTQKEQ